MPTKLKQLKVISVDFVDAGANPGAKISIFKSAVGQNDKDKGDPIPDSPEDSVDKEVDEKFSDLADKETEEKKVGKQLTDTEKLILKNFAASDYDKTEIAKCLGFNVSLSNADGTLTVSAGARAPDENKPADVQNSNMPPILSGLTGCLHSKIEEGWG